MLSVKDRRGSILSVSDWVRLIRVDYDGDYIFTETTQIENMNEYSIALKNGYYISDGVKLRKVACLELMSDEKEIMLAILENA